MAQQAGIRFPMYCIHNGLLITLSRLPPDATEDVNVHPSRSLEEVLWIIHNHPSTPELRQLPDFSHFRVMANDNKRPEDENKQLKTIIRELETKLKEALREHM